MIVRPFNTFGPRQSTRAVIPTIIVQALRHRQIDIGSTSPTRDFNFVKDIAHGFALAGNAAESTGRSLQSRHRKGAQHRGSYRKSFRAFSELNCCVREQAERMRPLSSEVHRLIADSAQGCMQLGWSPQTSFPRRIGTNDRMVRNP